MLNAHKKNHEKLIVRVKEWLESVGVVWVKLDRAILI